MKVMKSLIVLIILSNLFFNSCRTVRKNKVEEKEVTVEKVKKDSTIVKDTIKEKVVKEETKVEKVTNEKQNTGEVEVTGTTDASNPFELYNIQNGDTLSVTKITGNAEFIIKTKWKDNNSNIKEETSLVKLDKVAEVSRYIVSEDNIKNTAKEIKSITKEVKKSDIPLGYYSTILIILLLIYLGWKFRKIIFAKL